MREVKLALSISSCRDWKASFGASLCALVRHVSINGIAGVNLTHFDMNINQGASVLPRARQIAVEWAKQTGATHLLLIDDDMQFPGDILDNLFSNDVDVIACNYARKNPQAPTAMAHGIDGLVMSSVDRIGIEEAGWIGFGLVVVKIDAIRDIPAPLFEMRWLEERNDFIGEDFYFCGKARAHGAKIYIDHDASQRIAHIGDYPFKEAA